MRSIVGLCRTGHATMRSVTTQLKHVETRSYCGDWADVNCSDYTPIASVGGVHSFRVIRYE